MENNMEHLQIAQTGTDLYKRRSVKMNGCATCAHKAGE